MLKIIIAFLIGLVIGGKLGFELFRHTIKNLKVFDSLKEE